MPGSHETSEMCPPVVARSHEEIEDIQSPEAHGEVPIQLTNGIDDQNLKIWSRFSYGKIAVLTRTEDAASLINKQA